jgi:SAM-dependent methyltransferase
MVSSLWIQFDSALSLGGVALGARHLACKKSLPGRWTAMRKPQDFSLPTHPQEAVESQTSSSGVRRMGDWNAGYVADIGYTYGYYSELNPQRVSLPFLYSHLQPPKIMTACELGFGQGISTNIHAASSPVAWYANDFNPAQAAFARDLASVSAAEANLSEEAFDVFCARTDLPDFDFIGLHGIWSWISDANRHIIVDFIKRKLRPGGVLYVSYNTQPGWASMVPVRELLTDHADKMGAPGTGIAPRIDAALNFANTLLATNPRFGQANPQIAARLSEMSKQDRSYLAHEYFNRDWQPMSFSKMNEWLSGAKLSFACSAHFMDQFDQVNLSPEQVTLLSTISDPVFKETVRDFCVNRQFRRDYWVKGERKVMPLKRAEAISAHRVLLLQPREGIELKARGSFCEGNLQDEIYSPILDALANHKPMTIAQLGAATAHANIKLEQLIQAVFLLTGNNVLGIVQDDAVIEAARPRTRSLNRHICEQARYSADVHYLGSPVTGGAVSIDRMAQLFMLARRRGLNSARQMAEAAWSILDAQGQKIVHEGVTLATAEETIAELTRRANTFIEKVLPILIALQIEDEAPGR